MNQTKLESLEETLVNVGTGFIISMFIQFIFVPMITGQHPTAGQNVLVTCAFTVASIIRGFCVRRGYNAHRGFLIQAIRKLVK
jgi:hypothetical protein